MVSIESHTHSFVIRIWLEEEASVEHAGLWRGHITHVDSGERQYLRDLEDILRYMTPFLSAWGVDTPVLLAPPQPPSAAQESIQKNVSGGSSMHTS